MSDGGRGPARSSDYVVRHGDPSPSPVLGLHLVEDDRDLLPVCVGDVHHHPSELRNEGPLLRGARPLSM